MNNTGNIPLYSLGVILFLSAAAFAQTPSPSPTPAPPPVNDIFLIDVANRDAQMTFGKPLKITEWNGYNNQPFFFPDGQSLFYTSIRADKQADIYRYEIKGGRTSRVTETPESEYSPTVTPDKKFISVVRVEADGTQRLWKFPLSGGKPILTLEKIKPVGYQAWIDQNTLALFILGAAGKPSTLQIVDVRTEKAEVIAENIGRPLRLIPHQNKLSFVHKISAAEWIVKSFDLQTRQIATLIKTLPGSEDYAWTPAGVLLMAKDAKLFAWDAARDTGWREVADFSEAGLKSITRIAVSPQGNRIVIVARRIQSPMSNVQGPTSVDGKLNRLGATHADRTLDFGTLDVGLCDQEIARAIMNAAPAAALPMSAVCKALRKGFMPVKRPLI